mgnify:CR=1 FL=1
MNAKTFYRELKTELVKQVSAPIHIESFLMLRDFFIDNYQDISSLPVYRKMFNRYLDNITKRLIFMVTQDLSEYMEMSLNMFNEKDVKKILEIPMLKNFYKNHIRIINSYSISLKKHLHENYSFNVITKISDVLELKDGYMIQYIRRFKSGK